MGLARNVFRFVPESGYGFLSGHAEPPVSWSGPFRESGMLDPSRRQFITLLGGAAAWPVATRTQTPIGTGKLYRVAVLAPVPEVALRGFFDELRQQGLIEGQNLTIDRSGFNTDYEQLRSRAAELIKARPDAIFCAGDKAIRAAQMTTTTIPIVGSTDDMVGSGLARSLSRPGGNTTGVSLLAADLDAKRQEVLAEFFPTAKHMAALFDPKTTTPRLLGEIEYAARLLGVGLTTHRIERKEDRHRAGESRRCRRAQRVGVAIVARQSSGHHRTNDRFSPSSDLPMAGYC
jgi:ABC transporter substrate binding protein